jgi:hypothetical protein
MTAPLSEPSKKRSTYHFEHIEKQCPVCLRTFHVTYSARNAKTCSRTCHIESMKRLVIKKCLVCDKQFQSKPCKKTKTCSRRCGGYLRSGEGHYRWNRDREKVCPTCKKQYEPNSGWNKEQIFCSRKCLSEHYRNNGGPRSKPVGSRYKDDQGYWIIKLGVKSWRPEHIVIGEKMIGRKLARNEIVHHRNGNKADNREDNLEVVTKSIHARIHQKAEWLGLSIIAQRAALPIMAGEWIHPLEGCEV